ncbi:MAG: beta-ketoacyl synthase chain length factor [Rubrivivax sp.]|nr:beta-ketoacyl synthase chain length factor [Rubrivivax sp.]
MSVSGLQFDLHAAGVLAPGLPSLAALRAGARTAQRPAPVPVVLPAPERLPANERRRASPVVRLVLACVEQVLSDSPFPAQALRSVFATDEGTGDVCQQMLQALSTTRQVSPLVFPNSVQNAPSGNFSIAWQNRQSATVVSLGLESFASGLLCAVTEAVTSRAPVLLVAYDPPMTAPINELLPVVDATATAWVLTARRQTGLAGPTGLTPGLATFSLDLAPGQGRLPSPWPPWMPARWSANSSARGLATLGLLDAPAGSVMDLTLGGQMLTLRRITGAEA